jgi:signal transduction histidine kinase
MKFFEFPQKNYILLSVIAVCATLLAVLSYQYSISYSDQIFRLEFEDTKSNAKIQADYLSLILSNGLKSITTNLQVLSNSRGLQNHDNDSSILLDAVQQSTNELPDSYMWLDQNGKLVWLSGGGSLNEVKNQKPDSFDFSHMPYFTIPRNTNSPYYGTTVVEQNSKDKSPVRMYISYPILDSRDLKNNDRLSSFKGTITAIITFDLQSDLLKKQSSVEVQKNLVMLVDNDGTIMSSHNNQLVGKSIFQYASQIGGTQAQALNQFFRQSLAGYDNANSTDIRLDGKMSTIISKPINNNGKKLWTLYIISPHDLTSMVSSLSKQQNNFSTLMIVAIGTIAFGIAWVIISWNRGLESIVNCRTLELKKTNNYLTSINEQLKIHDKMQNEFINIASHEMKTPTQSILLHSSLLFARPEIREESIEAIRRSANRLQRLTNDILDVTRIESHTLKLNKERFNLKDIITGLLEEYDAEIDNGKVQLIYDDPKDFFILADKSRIIQVISNLLSNAIKFTKEGSISIITEKRMESNKNNNCNNYLVVSVVDTGTGLDPQVLPKLFSKFTTKSDMGIGLGLYISKNIIEAHGGKIWAHNNDVTIEERGATFSIILTCE